MRFQMVALLVLLTSFFCRPARAEVVHDEQLWVNLNAFIKVSEKWQVYGEYQPRFMENRDYLKTVLYRTAIEHLGENGFAYAIGYAFVEYPNPQYFHEDRPYLQLFHAYDLGELKVINRTRLEGRFFNHADEGSYRFRHLLRGQYALSQSWRAILWNEYFWNANSIEPRRLGRTPVLREGFDQNRAFIGMGYAYGEIRQHLVEAGYMNQYVNVREFDRSNHTMFLQSTWRF